MDTSTNGTPSADAPDTVRTVTVSNTRAHLGWVVGWLTLGTLLLAANGASTWSVLAMAAIAVGGHVCIALNRGIDGGE